MRTAVLASGSGTLLQAILDDPEVQVDLVMSDRDCEALARARAKGVTTCIVDRRSFGYREGIQEDQWDRAGFTRACMEVLVGHQIELVAMAGFMTILHESIFGRYLHHILNSHPALLPDFPGAHAVRDALKAGVTETGTTLHVATEVLDDSRYILAQQEVPVLPNDTEATLHERIKVEERRLYPQVLAAIQRGEIDLDGVVAFVDATPGLHSG